MTIGGLYRRVTMPAKQAVAARVPLSVYQQLFRSKAVGLAYHTVSDDPNPSVRHLFPYKTTAMFERDLQYLKEHCRVISYEQFQREQRTDTVRPGSILLTFDDGYSECASVVRSLLLKYELPCLFFVTADFIDNRSLFYRNKVSLCIEAAAAMEHDALVDALGRIDHGPASRLDHESFVQWVKSLPRAAEPTIDALCEALGVDWAAYLSETRPFMTADEIRRLAADGFTIGGHSRTHSRLGELPPDAVKREILDSCRTVREITGQEETPFAFPFSADGVDPGLLAALKGECDFLGAFFDCRGIRRDSSLLVDRVWADPPPGHDDEPSNVGSLLKAAYEDRVLSPQ